MPPLLLLPSQFIGIGSPVSSSTSLQAFFANSAETLLMRLTCSGAKVSGFTVGFKRESTLVGLGPPHRGSPSVVCRSLPARSECR